MVGVQVGEGNGLDPVDVELDAAPQRSLPHHLADGVRAVHEQPSPPGAQGEAGRVVYCREGVTDAEGEEVQADSRVDIAPVLESDGHGVLRGRGG
jgi:hypothetical protein